MRREKENKEYTDLQGNTWNDNQEKSFLVSSSKDLDPLMERIGDARFVLLGEASHGTHEYYTWRTAISKRLIQEKGFSFISVEGDWPACYQVNQFIKGQASSGATAKEVLKGFKRWPTWMWANWEITALVEWLRQYNKNRMPDRKIGFYGLDVYSLWESMETLLDYLQKEDPQAAKLAKEAIECFEPYGEEGKTYAQASGIFSESCKNQVLALLREIRKKAPNYNHDPEAPLNTEINARVAVDAERYYESMVDFGPEAWNIRDTHMVDTLNRIMDFHGPQAKAIVWEHNTHIGDARYTDMKRGGAVNVGQLIREQRSEEEVVLVGFGSYQGSVIAGNSWGAPMKKMEVPPAREGSVEALLHNESPGNKLLIFDRNNVKERFNTKHIPHRAIGVVYHPDRERYGNYVPSVLGRRYDAFIYIDQTQALHPLNIKSDSHQMPETYPFGV